MIQSNLTYLSNFWYSVLNNSLSLSCSMKAVLFALITVSILALGSASGQEIGNEPMLGLELVRTQPHYYLDDEGHTIVVGEVKNLRDFPVTDVRVLASFYTVESGEFPYETQVGATLLDVIPALGSSPYKIRSQYTDLDLTGVSINLLGFTSSAIKSKQLEIRKINTVAADTIIISGTITNNDYIDSTDTTVYALVYDSLTPPRLIRVDSTSTSVIMPGESFNYEFSLFNDDHAFSVRLIAESDSYMSNFIDIPIRRYLSQPLVIENIEIKTSNGDPAIKLYKDMPFYIQSTITGQGVIDIDYTYIVQIKHSAALPVVEFSGTFDNILTNSGLSRSLVEWIPQSSGLFFVETYVWSRDSIPLSNPGSILLLHVE